MRKKVIFIVVFTIVIILLALIVVFYKTTKTTVVLKSAQINNYNTNIEVTGYTDEVLMNPGKGFTSMYESIDNIRVADIDNDTAITSYDAYLILKTSIEDDG